MNRLLLIPVVVLLGLQGCKSVPTQPSPPKLASPEYVAGEFNQESLYDLLLAEIAGQNRLFPVALDNYVTQAKKTQDAGVAERATRIAQYLRDTDKIIETARIWREIDSENPEPYQIEANMLLHQGLYQEALPLVKKALEFDALRTLALIRGQANRINKDVLSSYVTMLKAFRTEETPRADLELTLALLHKAEGATQSALSAFNRALSIDPDNPEALIQKAELLREDEDIKGALQLIEAAFEQQPENRQLHILYTQLLFQTKQTKKGVTQAEALVQNNLKDHQLTYYLALLMLENEAPESALKAFNHLLELKPEDTSPNFYLGHIAQAKGDKETAIKHYSAVSNGNNVLQSLSRAIGLLNDSAEREKVESILSEARSSLPDQAPQLFTLEAEWLNLHNYKEEALTLLEDALGLFTDNTTLLYTRAMMVESTDFPLAEQDLRRVLELEPDNSTAQNALGYTLLLHTSRYEEALELIQAALNSEPEDPAILDSMGWALFKLERYNEALPYLEKAHALYSDPEVSSHLIQTYWALGQKDRALDLLNKSRAESPDNPFLEEAAQLIDAN
ncbi:tetratricopeptide repeat protein [Neptuniibacter caesariensis]|uniref:TPR domain protein n=1 Tax=Neptuniibacter caesariensis TaxID=207954 RepID=A0A7U8C3J2_NEPCE|nr:tetratricopeptide repeat protein [Neptuniibacter caesariensis]EAR60106.1 TPR domain protein [Oceanospirillum sp. MED92] [Neptuniibacter caesariensis]